MTTTTDIITTGKPNHVGSEEAYAEVRAVIAQPFDQAREISDAVALTIASWWATPGGPGAAFATLATTGAVELTALLDAIHDAVPDAKQMPQRDEDALNVLGTWAINHPSRKR